MPVSFFLFCFLTHKSGVSEILGHNSKADRLYANGAVILELLLSMAEDANDRAILVDTLQRFATRCEGFLVWFFVCLFLAETDVFLLFKKDCCSADVDCRRRGSRE